jgi:hypothetical protein
MGTAPMLMMWSFERSRPVVSQSMLTHSPGGGGSNRKA